MSFTQYSTNGIGSLDDVQFAWYVAGWPDNPVYSTQTNAYVRNFLAGPWTAWWSYRENDTGDRRNAFTQGLINAPINCSNGVSNPQITDTCIVSTSSGNICLGKLPNSLAYLYGGNPAKKLIKVTPDPYGNTEQNIWIFCVRQGNYDMYQRIWTQNIT